MEIFNQIATPLIASAATAFGQWLFFYRKHKLANDQTLIKNLGLIAEEWREVATQALDTLTEYGSQMKEQSAEILRLNKELMTTQSRVIILEEKLKRNESQSN